MEIEVFGIKYGKKDLIRMAIAFVCALAFSIRYMMTFGFNPPVLVPVLYLILACVPIRFSKNWTRDLYLGFTIAFFTFYFTQLGISLSIYSLAYYHAESLLSMVSIFWGPEALFTPVFLAGTLYMLLRLCRVNPKVSAAIVPVPFLALSIADIFVLHARGYELISLDIVNVSTAASVAGNYDYNFVPVIFFVIFPYILLLMAILNVGKKEEKPARRAPGKETAAPAPKAPAYSRKQDLLLCGITSVVLIACTTLFYITFRATHRLQTFNTEPSFQNTFIMNFLYSLEYFHTPKPDGYSVNAIDEISAPLVQAAPDTASWIDDDVNIIVIMNEAFADMSVYESKFTSYTDPAPFYHQLIEEDPNCVSGYFLASVFGSNTANSEFEFLTGLTMGYQNEGMVPYSTSITKPVISLPRYLADYGYTSIGMHPCTASNWKRNVVYPLMGFNDTMFDVDMKMSVDDLIRNYIADRTAYDRLTKQIEQYHAEGKERVFAFLVTLQNHGGFSDYNSYDNFTMSEYVTAPADSIYDVNEMNCYQTLIKESDDALKELIEYFQAQDEKYVVFFFGDHQPAVYGLFNAADYPQQSYEVPFFLWANYDIPEEVKASVESNFIHTDVTRANTSMNYCAMDVLQFAGIPFSPYYKTLSAIREETPVINYKWYYNKQSGVFEEIPDGAQPNELLKLYSYIEYDALFDKKNSSLTDF